MTTKPATATTATPAAPVADALPHEGGSYIRQADGTLVRASTAPAPAPAATDTPAQE